MISYVYIVVAVVIMIAGLVGMVLFLIWIFRGQVEIRRDLAKIIERERALFEAEERNKV